MDLTSVELVLENSNLREMNWNGETDSKSRRQVSQELPYLISIWESWPRVTDGILREAINYQASNVQYLEMGKDRPKCTLMFSDLDSQIWGCPGQLWTGSDALSRFFFCIDTGFHVLLYRYTYCSVFNTSLTLWVIVRVMLSVTAFGSVVKSWEKLHKLSDTLYCQPTTFS